MAKDDTKQLNELATHWTNVHIALLGTGPDATRAQADLFQRYGGAMRRYLQAALRDSAAVDDLMQEFAVALVSGAFRNVQPERGRFRDFLKAVLFHMVRKYRRQQYREALHVASGVDLTDFDSNPSACDDQFRQSWRDEALARTWEALNDYDPAYFKVLHFRADHPDMASEEMAKALCTQLGEEVTGPGMRQKLHRARKRFRELLLQHVAGSLEFPSPDAIFDELRDLGLAEYLEANRTSVR